MYRTRTFVRRHFPSVVAATTGLVLLSGLITFYTIQLQRERDRAQLEATKAARMTQFMTDLLHASDPYADRAREGEPTVRELLDAGASRVDRELAGRPELQADIMTEIGRVYQRLRLKDKARPILEKALARAREADGPSSARVAESLNHLGVQLRDEDWQRSVALLKEALEMRRRVLGPEDAKVAITLVELSRTYVDRGMPEEAEPLLREALAIRRKVHGNMHRETGTSLNDLGQLLRERGDLAQAEALFRENVAISRKVLPRDHPNAAASLTNLAQVLNLRGDHKGAEALYREALDIYAKVPDFETHHLVASTWNNLSYALRGQGRLDEAEAAARKSLPLMRAARGPRHSQTASVMINVARFEIDHGRFAEAEALLEPALKIRQETFPATDRSVAFAKNWLGAAYTGLGRYAEAEPLLIEAERIISTVPDVWLSEKRSVLTHLITLYESWGKRDQAAPYRSRLSAMKSG